MPQFEKIKLFPFGGTGTMAGSKKPAWMAKSIALTRNSVHVLIALGFPIVMPLPQIRKLGHRHGI